MKNVMLCKYSVPSITQVISEILYMVASSAVIHMNELKSRAWC
jgi:phenylpyruvate tautomerase PptA (4-oxalocrotonate tautomerase family)